MTKPKPVPYVIILFIFAISSHSIAQPTDEGTDYYVKSLSRLDPIQGEMETIDITGSGQFGTPHQLSLQEGDVFTVRIENNTQVGNHGLQVPELFPKVQNYEIWSAEANALIRIDKGDVSIDFVDAFDLTGFVANMTALEEYANSLEPFSEAIETEGIHLTSIFNSINIGYIYHEFNSTTNVSHHQAAFYGRDNGLLFMYYNQFSLSYEVNGEEVREYYLLEFQLLSNAEVFDSTTKVKIQVSLFGSIYALTLLCTKKRIRCS